MSLLLLLLLGSATITTTSRCVCDLSVYICICYISFQRLILLLTEAVILVSKVDIEYELHICITLGMLTLPNILRAHIECQ